MKEQYTKVVIIGLIAITIEIFTGSRPLGASEIPSTSVEETPVISVENVKPLETPSGTQKDLGEISGNNNNQWWGMGGDNNSSDISEGSIYQVNDKSKPDVASPNWQQEQKDWQSATQGDYNPPSSKIPFAHF
ncbi:hypothetical protein [Gloeothece verrucosa]|uniref:Uncharacterized protein n=1 Tax=Gloeothece verrucosa (strain PCC 7822) TaxID=497965 RepID=E0U7W7_GLOV7|nr:hypothetical protein [Gloeothece verrucosa]ADN16054.1 hypothetical protein Cyan7822_4136 [Gloeothece verrucosa PCC 7822]